MKRLTICLFFILLFSHTSHSNETSFPEIVQGDIQPNDERLGKPIGKSKQGEVTIASFNIRNLGARKRSLKDFAHLADLIDEADVVMIQEAGLGVYHGTNVKKIRPLR